ncbi:hypothetical protein [Ensifer adhaerens]|uniref:Uncharacterized protein n=1 Tax=Ensifer adhaerens TaxID=106592 RepID=A0A9Q9DAW4_ENSAD|nr:hypothetical protein [Ensifer adhaerens]USJ24684.1 hypothetical protein NE863_06885 [Ensifer adhaerens]
MEWIAAAIVAVFLLWRYPKPTLKIGAVILLIGAGALGWLFWQDHQRAQRAKEERAKIEVLVSTENPYCKDADYPLWISVGNRNLFGLDAVTVNVSARQKGFSKKVFETRYTIDKILAPKEGYGNCYSLGDQAPANPRDLDWEISLSYFDRST